MFNILTFNGVDLAIIFIFSAIFIFFPLQLLFCFKMKKIWIKLIPLVLSGLITITFALIMLFSTGWGKLGWLLMCIYSLASIIFCGISWLIYILIKVTSK